MKHDQESLNSELLEACKCGNLRDVWRLIEKGADVNSAKEYEYSKTTQLSMAAEHSRVEVMKYLISVGALINTTEERIKSALIHAAKEGQDDAVMFLINAGANMQTKDIYGATALHWASDGDHAQSTKILLDANALIDDEDDEGNTPLTNAASVNSVRAISILLEYGANENHVNKSGRTAKQIAQLNGNDAAIAVIEAHIEHRLIIQSISSSLKSGARP